MLQAETSSYSTGLVNINLSSVKGKVGLARAGTVVRPSLAQFLLTYAHFMHPYVQIMREIVEPLRESRQRELATIELARLVRERAFDIGVEAHEVDTFAETV